MAAATLGIAAGVAGAQSPAQDQYGQPQTTSTTPQGTVAGQQTTGGQGSTVPGAENQGVEGARGSGNGRTVGGGASGAGGGTPAVKGATTGGNGTRPLEQANGNKLPFTGFDLALIALLGLALLAVGLMLRFVQRVRPGRG